MLSHKPFFTLLFCCLGAGGFLSAQQSVDPGGDIIIIDIIDDLKPAVQVFPNPVRRGETITVHYHGEPSPNLVVLILDNGGHQWTPTGIWEAWKWPRTIQVPHHLKPGLGYVGVKTPDGVIATPLLIQ